MKVPAYNKANRKNSGGNFEQLPKGNYVCKIMSIAEHTSRTGKAMVKRLAHAHPENLVEQERARGSAAQLAKTNAGGSVDLF